jgi:hypothetical protein
MQAGLRLEIEVVSGIERLREMLAGLPGVAQVLVREQHLTCHWRQGKEALPDLHRRIVAAGIDLISLEVRTDSLEDLYMKISGHETA